MTRFPGDPFETPETAASAGPATLISRGMSARFAEVLVPVAVAEPYSYAVPDGLDLAVGDLVEVPLGPRRVTGVVWSLAEAPRYARPGRLKPVEARLDAERLRPELMAFVDWVAGYTLSPRGMVLRMAMRPRRDAGADRARASASAALGRSPPRMTRARARVLAALEGGLCSCQERARPRGRACRSAVIDGLVDEGALEAVALPPEPAVPPPRPGPSHRRRCRPAQAAAAATL